MSVLIKGGRIVTAADDYVGDVYAESETVTLIGRVARRRGRQGDRRDRKDRHARRDRPAHAPRDGVRGHRHVRRLHVRHRVRSVRRYDDAGRLLRPGARQQLSRGAGNYHEKIERAKPVIDVGAHIGDHRSSKRRIARRPRDDPGRGRDVVQALHGLQGRRDGRRRDALQDDAGCARYGCARDGARRERRRDRRPRARRRSPRASTARSGTRGRARRITEGEATNRAIQLARVAGAPLYVVHVSCKESIEPDRPRAHGRLAGVGRDVHAVPVRRRVEARSAELRGRQVRVHAAATTEGEPGAPLARPRHGRLSVVSTDHCPFNWDGQKTLGKDDFSKIPNGGPGIENRLHMLYTSASAEAASRSTASSSSCRRIAAKFFGLYPTQGHDRVGSDADIVVWDPEKR